MTNNPKFIFLTAPGGRLPAWLRIWLAIAAIAAGAILLWFGLILAFAVVLAGTLALLPVWAWRLFKAGRQPQDPAIIEGEYTVTAIRPAGVRDESQDQKSSVHVE